MIQMCDSLVQSYIINKSKFNKKSESSFYSQPGALRDKDLPSLGGGLLEAEKIKLEKRVKG